MYIQKKYSYNCMYTQIWTHVYKTIITHISVCILRNQLKIL